MMSSFNRTGNWESTRD